MARKREGMKGGGFNIVLVEPEIPTNTGNIGRLCVASNSTLHLVRPWGFEIDDSRVRRAGLDYWKDLQWEDHPHIDSVLEKANGAQKLFFSARAEQSLYEQTIEPGDWLFFGKEAQGFSEEVKRQFANELVKIPFPGKVRSFNLANAVAMVLGEGIRQTLIL